MRNTIAKLQISWESQLPSYKTVENHNSQATNQLRIAIAMIKKKQKEITKLTICKSAPKVERIKESAKNSLMIKVDEK